MRIVIDTKEIAWRIKFFWKHQVLRKPLPEPDFKALMEAVMINAIAGVVAGEVSKVIKETKFDDKTKK